MADDLRKDLMDPKRRRWLAADQEHWIELDTGHAFADIPARIRPQVWLGYHPGKKAWSVKTKFFGGSYDGRPNILADADAPGATAGAGPIGAAYAGGFERAVAKALGWGIPRGRKWIVSDPQAKPSW